MENKTYNVAVTGAAGQIGYALLFSLAAGRMLGENIKINLNLIELPHALEALKGVMMELQDCAFPLINSIKITSNLEEGFKNIDWAILVGSAPRKAGMERSDLLKINGSIFSEQGKALNNFAKSDAKVLVVGNPCNTNCMVAQKNAPNLNPKNFFAMTMLDQHRAYAQLALKANVKVEEIKDMIIFGNHSSTQFPDIENATISNKPAKEVISDHNWLENDFIKTVQQRGAAIISARGASSAASAANAAIDTIAYIEGIRSINKTFSVATISSGEYGSKEGLIVSFPCIVKDGQLEKITNWNHSKWSKDLMKQSFDELEEEALEVKKLGFI